MANEEHVHIARGGGNHWNEWRNENPYAPIDLRGADLSNTFLTEENLRGLDLTGADLRGTDLMRADLRDAILSDADLREAEFNGADLRRAHLENANLEKAIFNHANLSEANLSKANLRKASFFEAKLSKTVLISADLSKANFESTYLVGADLSNATLNEASLVRAYLVGTNLRDTLLSGSSLVRARFIETCLTRTNFARATTARTVFANLDLREAIGLDKINHFGPSDITTTTLTLSKGKIPEVFLRGCGLSDWEVAQVKLLDPELSSGIISQILSKMYDLRATRALQISNIFISCCPGDSSFVDKLDSKLKEKGVLSWRDVNDATAGRSEKVIDRAIRQNPVVLLILSEHSIKSDRVEHEVRLARELEKETGRDTLCPIALDNSWVSSSWPQRVMEQIMEYNILDFSDWRDDRKFDEMFRRLIDGLDLFYK